MKLLEINLEEKSAIMADAATKKWMNWIDSLIRGKKISFRGMLWESKGHQWEDFTVTVAAIRPNNSGNPFYSEIHILSDEGKNYTILASEAIIIH